MKTTLRSKFLGFTLIELLFVIAIASVLVTLGVSMVQQQNQQAKVEKAALQMQQLMQAAMAYYVDNGCWPSSSTPSVPCKSGGPLFATYIPVFNNATSTNLYPNPWGSTYSWGQSSTTPTSLFAVWVNTPSAQIAQRIAGMLPNAGVGPGTPPVLSNCTAANNCVYAQTTIPGQAAGGSGVVVAAVGTINFTNFTPAPDGSGSYVSTSAPINFTCPSGYSQLVGNIGSYSSNDPNGSGAINVNSPIFPIQISYSSNCSSTSPCNVTLTTLGRLCSMKNINQFACSSTSSMQPPQAPFQLVSLNYTVYCCINKQTCGLPPNP